MKELLEINWEKKYREYIDVLNFKDLNLKSNFLELLNQSDSLLREKQWSNIYVKLINVEEIYKLSNPFYIGAGNPNSNILFLGKEKAFDIVQRPELLIKESVNNILHWNYIQNNPNADDLLNSLGYNPLFPRGYHNQNLRPRHTWGLYSQIIAGLENKDKKELFEETNNLTNSLFNYCFTSELNHIPSKYSQGRKLIGARKELLKNKFFRRFNKIIVGAKGYVELNELTELLGTSAVFKEITLGRNNGRVIKAFLCIDNQRKIIYCDQLSGSAGWTNEAITALIHVMK
jgi:hypothetical protein